MKIDKRLKHLIQALSQPKNHSTKIAIVVVLGHLFYFSSFFISTYSRADLAVGARLGSMGVGVDIAKQINERFNLRIAFSGYQFEYESTEDEIEYDFKLDIGATGLLIDWYPFEGGLRVSTGLYSNSTKLVGVATPVGSYGIGGTNYSPDDIGVLTATIDLGSTAPYVGIGWGYDLANAGFGLALDIGLLVQSSPDVVISASKIDQLPESVDLNQLRQDLKQEANELEDSLSDFELYPVAIIGVTYIF